MANDTPDTPAPGSVVMSDGSIWYDSVKVDVARSWELHRERTREPTLTVADSEEGWVRIGVIDSRRRRSLWLREGKGWFELRAGREGDDAHVRVDRSNPQFSELSDVLSYARFASET